MTSRAKKLVQEIFSKAQSSLVLQASDLSLETIASMVQSKSIDITPKYQRRERWSTDKQRALIESIIMNIPIPPIYLFEEQYGTYSVIDGKQRTISIHAFMNNELYLTSLKEQQLNPSLAFQDMPIEVQNAFRIRPYIRVVTLLSQSSQEMKYEVFRRLNESGVPLNPQEIRNVVYRGNLNDLIYELSESKLLLKTMKIRSTKDPAHRQMLNAEVVLRFFVLANSWRNFSGAFRDSMDEYMKSKRNPTTAELERLKGRFIRALEFNVEVFARHAFKRPSSDGWRDQFMIGMYDAQMVAANELSDRQLDACKSDAGQVGNHIRQAFLKDEEFQSAVREATNTPSRIRYRIEKVINILESF